MYAVLMGRGHPLADQPSGVTAVEPFKQWRRIAPQKVARGR